MSEYLVTVRWDYKLPKLATLQQMTIAIGSTKEWLKALQKSFNKRVEIDKSRNLWNKNARNIFAREVCAWLEGALTTADKDMIYRPKAQQSQQYPPPLAMYHIANYFKRKLQDDTTRKKNRIAGRDVGGPGSCRSLDFGDPNVECAGRQSSEERSGNDAEASRHEGACFNLDNSAELATRNDADYDSDLGRNESHSSPIYYSSPFPVSTPDLSTPDNGLNEGISSPIYHAVLEPTHPSTPVISLSGSNSYLDQLDDRSFLWDLDRCSPEDIDTVLDYSYDSPGSFIARSTSVRSRSGTSEPTIINPDIDTAIVQLDLLIEDTMALRAEVTGWGELSHAEFITKLSARYQQLRDAITVKPFDSGNISAPVSSMDASETANRFMNFHIRIWGEIEPVRGLLERNNPSFQNIWGPEAKTENVAAPFRRLLTLKQEPVFLVAAGPSGGGKSHTMVRPNANDKPVIEVMLVDAHRIHGALRMGVKNLQGKITTDVPFTKPEFEGKHHRPALREILSSPHEIAEFVQALQAPGVGADNGINRISSRWHVLIDAFSSTGQLIFSVLDLCGDEMSKTRAGPLLTESNKIASDLILIRTLLTELKLTLCTKFPSLKYRRAHGITGRGCALTTIFLNRLTLAPKVHVILFGNGKADKGIISRAIDVWKPFPQSTIVGRKKPKTPTWDFQSDIFLKQLKEKHRLGWKEIATHFPGRTPNACQFRWRRLGETRK